MSTQIRSDRAEGRERAPRKGLALALIAAAQFVVIMDTSIIGVALPDIRQDVGFSADALSWVFNAYVIAFGGLLLLGGRLADLFGARRMFVTGWIILLVGSVAAGLATTPGVEIAARAFQGAGAALIAPAALTLLMSTFGGTASLPRAFAVYGAAAPIGGTAGVFLGGVLTEYLGWPWVFYVTVPIAIVILALVPRAFSETPRATGRIDVFGAVTGTAGLALAVFGIVRAPEAGWLDPSTLLPLALGLVLVIAFVVRQFRAAEPLLRPGLLRTPLLGGANIAQLLLGAAWIPMWFFLNLYLQNVLGASAFAAGAALIPMTALIVFGMTAIAPRLAARWGTLPMVAIGFTLLAGGMLWLSFARPGGTYVVDVLPATLVAATGMAFAFVPSLSTAIASAPIAESGVASGLVNTSYQVGSALGLAALTAVSSTIGAAGGDAAGYASAFLGAAGVAVVGAVVAVLTLRTRRA
ncbi:EmrB/QacA subfamily drug resistance transporter [Microbacterium resistens]|uniref:EmrB/QacA subfamily drug resistance transporter n=1 Tax=Microbacterium resistens TaxID=156977 RepID=A0ABU1S916_9MICO|nr:MFS transporter [Microbacterium resistens]MDR6866086.1 EmrB/QacA subfamily drug resistance transporter [Microbacterium resistens]